MMVMGSPITRDVRSLKLAGDSTRTHVPVVQRQCGHRQRRNHHPPVLYRNAHLFGKRACLAAASFAKTHGALLCSALNAVPVPPVVRVARHADVKFVIYRSCSGCPPGLKVHHGTNHSSH